MGIKMTTSRSKFKKVNGLIKVTLATFLSFVMGQGAFASSHHCQKLIVKEANPRRYIEIGVQLDLSSSSRQGTLAIQASRVGEKVSLIVPVKSRDSLKFDPLVGGKEKDGRFVDLGIDENVGSLSFRGQTYSMECDRN